MVVQTDVQRENKLRAYFSKAWLLAFLEGSLAVGIGGYLLLRPAASLESFLRILAGYIAVNGVFKAVAAISGGRLEWWWIRLVGGIVLSVAGVSLFSYPLYDSFIPAQTAAVIAGTLIMTGGILTTTWGVGRGGIFFGEGWVLMSGLLAILFGFILIFSPFVALKTADSLAGAASLLSGTIQLFGAFSLRRRAKKEPSI